MLEVLGLPTEWAGRRIGAERHRADVVAAGIGGNVMGSGRDAEFETFDAKWRKPQVPVRTNDTKRMHARFSSGQRPDHISVRGSSSLQRTGMASRNLSLKASGRFG